MPVLSAVLVALALTLPGPDQGLQGPFAPALRITPPVQEVEAPAGSRCPELFAVAVENWPNAEAQWAYLDHVFWREARCRSWVVNRYGCTGLGQICPVNFRFLGESRASLRDAGTNIAAMHRLYEESIRTGKSGWRPWWLRGWRP